MHLHDIGDGGQAVIVLAKHRLGYVLGPLGGKCKEEGPSGKSLVAANRGLALMVVAVMRQGP